jgi:hypothetical protein
MNGMERDSGQGREWQRVDEETVGDFDVFRVVRTLVRKTTSFGCICGRGMAAM